MQVSQCLQCLFAMLVSSWNLQLGISPPHFWLWVDYGRDGMVFPLLCWPLKIRDHSAGSMWRSWNPAYICGRICWVGPGHSWPSILMNGTLPRGNEHSLTVVMRLYKHGTVDAGFHGGGVLARSSAVNLCFSQRFHSCTHTRRTSHNIVQSVGNNLVVNSFDLGELNNTFVHNRTLLLLCRV